MSKSFYLLIVLVCLIIVAVIFFNFLVAQEKAEYVGEGNGIVSLSKPICVVDSVLFKGEAMPKNSTMTINYNGQVEIFYYVIECKTVRLDSLTTAIIIKQEY